MTKNTSFLDIISNSLEEVPSSKTPTNIATELKQTPSLFDSMLFDTSSDSNLENENVKINNLEESQKNFTKQDNLKKDTNSSTSLLDQMMKDIFQQIEEDKNVEVSNNNIKDDIKNVLQNEKTLSLLDKMIEDVSKQIVQENENKPTSTTNLLLDKMIENSNKQIVQDSINLEEQISSKENKPSSLLDKLVDEVKTQIKKETIVVNETKIDEKSIITKENIVKESSLNGDLKTTLVQTQNFTTKVVNEKVAYELANLNSGENKSLNIAKEDILNTQNQKDSSKSLMDRLLDDTKKVDTKLVETTVSKNEQNGAKQEQNTSVLNNIYQSSQNKNTKDISLEKVYEAKSVLDSGTTIKEIKKSADILNLDLKSSEIIQEENKSNLNTKNEFLNRLSVVRDTIKQDIRQDITKTNDEIVQQSSNIKNETTISVAEKMKFFNSLPQVEMSVSSTTAYNIENRIIGAKQQMNQMMSDVARSMYENYKPPITAFRLNLNPGNLGSIAILMKNDKTDGLSISLNMSNQATLESFIDNQAMLKSALAKNFNVNANVNLEFNMQSGDQQNSDSNSGESKGQNKNHRATNDILETLHKQSESEQIDTNYM